MAVKRTDTFTIRFIRGDEDDKDAFYDQLDASGSDNKSEFAKQLISKALHPPDPTQGATIQALLRDVLDASGGIQSDLQELKLKNNQDRRALANAVGVLLHKIANLPKEETKRWVDKNILK